MLKGSFLPRAHHTHPYFHGPAIVLRLPQCFPARLRATRHHPERISGLTDPISIFNVHCLGAPNGS